MDRVFRVKLERSRVYWDYYKSMFLVFSGMLLTAALITAVIYHKGGYDFILMFGLIAFFFLCVIMLAALLSLAIWRHENKFLDEMITVEEPTQEEPPRELV